MDIFGVGLPELLFAALIALIVLGPKDIVKTGRTVGRFLNKMIRSETWHAVQYMWNETRYLPNRLMREANLEEQGISIEQTIGSQSKMAQMRSDLQRWRADVDITDWTTPPDPGPQTENDEASTDASQSTQPQTEQPATNQE